MGRPLTYWCSGGSLLARPGSHKPKPITVGFAYRLLLSHRISAETGPEPERAFHRLALSDLARALVAAEGWARCGDRRAA